MRAPGPAKPPPAPGAGRPVAPGAVHGRLLDGGWGASMGYPAPVLERDGPATDVQVFESSDLLAHWARLDEIDGPGYRVQVTSAERSACADEGRAEHQQKRVENRETAPTGKAAVRRPEWRSDATPRARTAGVGAPAQAAAYGRVGGRFVATIPPLEPGRSDPEGALDGGWRTRRRASTRGISWLTDHLASVPARTGCQKISTPLCSTAASSAGPGRPRHTG